jgi:hypothetical protein
VTLLLFEYFQVPIPDWLCRPGTLHNAFPDLTALLSIPWFEREKARVPVSIESVNLKSWIAGFIGGSGICPPGVY